VLVADRRVRVQRIPVAVQPRDGDTGLVEDGEVVVAGRVTGQDVVERGDVHSGQETAGVDLDARQAEVGDHRERVRQGPVMQDCVVKAELHHVSQCGSVTGAAQYTGRTTPRTPAGSRGWGRPQHQPGDSARYRSVFPSVGRRVAATDPQTGGRADGARLSPSPDPDAPAGAARSSSRHTANGRSPIVATSPKAPWPCLWPCSTHLLG
jgi:hypothetical protein